jgi:hypothetical protein
MHGLSRRTGKAAGGRTSRLDADLPTAGLARQRGESELDMARLGRLAPVAIRGRYQIGFKVFRCSRICSVG